MYQLRPYQQEAVDATLNHFRRRNDPAVIVLPTGAGKSLVIAELAKIAKGRVLVLAHVKELVEQNHSKYESFNLKAGIYSAGLNRKDENEKVIFGSIQSVANASEDFFKEFTLLVIDECHRVSIDPGEADGETQYLKVITELRTSNPKICILGLTATPYRLGLGWIYEYHLLKKIIRSKKNRFFKKCIYELPLSFMVKNKYLTPPIKIDSPVACYDFSTLKLRDAKFSISDVEAILKDQKRITPVIIQNIIDMSVDRMGVMIFTTTVRHAKEILELLPKDSSSMVIGDTNDEIRDSIINKFKNKELKYLVNVSVLTTGFDAPHVDIIAILRPTESVGLYQQIIGRGLRLSPNKNDCLILDYTGQNHDIYSPEIEAEKSHSDSVVVEIQCPKCLGINEFWGIKDEEGEVTEHFGRKCQLGEMDQATGKIIECGFRFRFKRCDQCDAENDIAARECNECGHLLVDTDTKLKEAMALKDAHVMRVDSMFLKKTLDKKHQDRLEVSFYDVDGESLKEYFYFNSIEDQKRFYFNFVRIHLKRPEQKIFIHSIDEAINKSTFFRMPLFIIARKDKQYWQIREKIF
jgi:DNA repair protein RadD